MGASVLQCGKLFDGVSDRLTGPVEIAGYQIIVNADDWLNRSISVAD
jgi:hypothetical protein